MKFKKYPLRSDTVPEIHDSVSGVELGRVGPPPPQGWGGGGPSSTSSMSFRDELPYQLRGMLDMVDRSGYNNIKWEKGYTMLHLAAARGNEPLCRYLLDVGADVHDRDVHGMLPVQYAKSHGHKHLVELLCPEERASSKHSADAWQAQPVLGGEEELHYTHLPAGIQEVLRVLDEDGDGKIGIKELERAAHGRIRLEWHAKVAWCVAGLALLIVVVMFLSSLLAIKWAVGEADTDGTMKTVGGRIIKMASSDFVIMDGELVQRDSDRPVATVEKLHQGRVTANMPDHVLEQLKELELKDGKASAIAKIESAGRQKMLGSKCGHVLHFNTQFGRLVIDDADLFLSKQAETTLKEMGFDLAKLEASAPTHLGRRLEGGAHMLMGLFSMITEYPWECKSVPKANIPTMPFQYRAVQTHWCAEMTDATESVGCRSELWGGRTKPGVKDEKTWMTSTHVMETPTVRVEVEWQAAHPLQRLIRLTRKGGNVTKYQILDLRSREGALVSGASLLYCESKKDNPEATMFDSKDALGPLDHIGTTVASAADDLLPGGDEGTLVHRFRISPKEGISEAFPTMELWQRYEDARPYKVFVVGPDGAALRPNLAFSNTSFASFSDVQEEGHERVINAMLGGLTPEQAEQECIYRIENSHPSVYGFGRVSEGPEDLDEEDDARDAVFVPRMSGSLGEDQANIDFYVKEMARMDGTLGPADVGLLSSDAEYWTAMMDKQKKSTVRRLLNRRLAKARRTADVVQRGKVIANEAIAKVQEFEAQAEELQNKMIEAMPGWIPKEFAGYLPPMGVVSCLGTAMFAGLTQNMYGYWGTCCEVLVPPILTSPGLEICGVWNTTENAYMLILRSQYAPVSLSPVGKTGNLTVKYFGSRSPGFKIYRLVPVKLRLATKFAPITFTLLDDKSQDLCPEGFRRSGQCEVHLGADPPHYWISFKEAVVANKFVFYTSTDKTDVDLVQWELQATNRFGQRFIGTSWTVLHSQLDADFATPQKRNAAIGPFPLEEPFNSYAMRRPVHKVMVEGHMKFFFSLGALYGTAVRGTIPFTGCRYHAGLDLTGNAAVTFIRSLHLYKQPKARTGWAARIPVVFSVEAFAGLKFMELQAGELEGIGYEGNCELNSLKTFASAEAGVTLMFEEFGRGLTPTVNLEWFAVARMRFLGFISISRSFGPRKMFSKPFKLGRVSTNMEPNDTQVAQMEQCASNMTQNGSQENAPNAADGQCANNTGISSLSMQQEDNSMLFQMPAHQRLNPCDSSTPVGRFKRGKCRGGARRCVNNEEMCCCPNNKYWHARQKKCVKCGSDDGYQRAQAERTLEERCAALTTTATLPKNKCEYVFDMKPGDACWGRCWRDRNLKKKEYCEQDNEALTADSKFYWCKSVRSFDINDLDRDLRCGGQFLGFTRGVCLAIAKDEQQPSSMPGSEL